MEFVAVDSRVEKLKNGISNGLISIVEAGNYIDSHSECLEFKSNHDLKFFSHLCNYRRVIEKNEDVIAEKLKIILSVITKDSLVEALDVIFNNPVWVAIEVLADLVKKGYLTPLLVTEKALMYENGELLYRILMLVPGVPYGRIASALGKTRDCHSILSTAQIISLSPMDEDTKKNIIKVLEKSIIALKVPHYFEYFSRVKGASIPDLANGLLKCDGDYAYLEFIHHNHDSIPPEVLKQLILKSIRLGDASRILAFSVYDVVPFNEYFEQLLLARKDEYYANILIMFVDLHLKKLEEMAESASSIEKNPFVRIGHAMMKTRKHKEMMKFILNYEQAPFCEIIDRIAEVHALCLIDISCSNNPKCALYATDKIICLGDAKLLAMAKINVKDPVLLSKLEEANNLLTAQMEKEKNEFGLILRKDE